MNPESKDYSPLQPAITSLDWHKRLKNRRAISAIAALCLSIIAFYFSYSILRQATDIDGEKITVVVATDFINSNTELNSNMFSLLSIPKKYVPEGAISNPKELEGIITKHALSANEVFTTHSIKEIIRNDSLATKLENDSYAMVLSETWFQAPFPEVREDDWLEVIAAQPGQNYDTTQILTDPIKVIQVNKEKQSGSQNITVNVEAETAKRLLFALSNKTKMILVLSDH